MGAKPIGDMRSLQKTMQEVDANRLARIRDARDSGSIKKIARMWAEEKLRPKFVNETQRMAIHFMVDFVHNYTYKWIAMRIGVSLSELYAWRNDPVFLAALDKEITRRKTYMRIHAFRNVHRAIARGDMKATWNYLKMTGDLKEHVEYNDRTGEKELSDEELKQQIASLANQVAYGPEPSTS